MNYNVVTYIVYLLLMGYITVVVGWRLFVHGQVFVDRIFADDRALSRTVNRLLLTGYYLVNLGYVAVTVNGWIAIDSLRLMIESIAVEIGGVVILLALMHYLNIAVLWWHGTTRAQHAS